MSHPAPSHPPERDRELVLDFTRPPSERAVRPPLPAARMTLELDPRTGQPTHTAAAPPPTEE